MWRRMREKEREIGRRGIVRRGMMSKEGVEGGERESKDER